MSPPHQLTLQKLSENTKLQSLSCLYLHIWKGVPIDPSLKAIGLHFAVFGVQAMLSGPVS